MVASMINRAESLAGELEEIYKRDLNSQNLSHDALNLTHEVLEKCSNILDQIMTIVFDQKIRPLLQNAPEKPRGYFPIAEDEHSYRSSLGRWGCANLSILEPTIDEKLRSLQPFSGHENKIYLRIRELANHKHTGLVPQKRNENRFVNVSSPSGSVSWGPGVVFGSGVEVMGVPIDPNTQMPAHQHGVDVSVERWVSFHFEDHDENALVFCKDSINAVKRVFNILLNF